VAESDRESLAVEVRDYEPAVALFAGRGLDIYRRLIPGARDLLVRGGYLAMEIGYRQDSAIARLLAKAGVEEIEFTGDLQGIPRVVSGRRMRGTDF
jgi:release factor glutamine methyltransferase